MLAPLTAFLVLFAQAHPCGQPPKDEVKSADQQIPLAKALLGKWKITSYVNGRPTTFEKSLELKADGTYIEVFGSETYVGKYELYNRNNLELTRTDRPGLTAPANLMNLKLEGGKVTRYIRPMYYDEWTRVEEKPAGKKDGKE